ncbi:uncharacterized protein LOC123308106 isoform X2 [Coccinella septempunctata]|uniref:uncharacterized protein LOC123308106 isoform X2 n=1 Tax=Coccinella septempunctata TaxID=41139 RepID=UPI001D087EB0|nr:uncharacterized protein LOC123308106 isoform X2 [Coccinella septempunctata]
MALIFDVLLMNEEIRNHRNALRKKQYRRIQRNLRDNSNPFELPDKIFTKLFRLDKETCQLIIHSISEHMHDSQRSTFVPKHLRILCTLHFLGHGSYQTPTGQLHQIALSQPMVSRSIAEVTDLIVKHLLHRYIIFPVGENRNRVQDTFNEKFPHFNGLCGVIDCTHIKIISPPVNHSVHPAAPYYCRKGYYSINTQILFFEQIKIRLLSTLPPSHRFAQ